MLGRANAPLTVVMYGDYTCPYTRRASLDVDLARKKLGHRVRFAFRHFPREDLNPDAILLAEAAHAGASQGKFWEMHQELLLAEDPLDPAALARRLDLDLHRFASELRERTHRRHVAQELDGGLRSGVNATPTIFINDRRHVGSWENGRLLRAMGGAPAMSRSAHL